MSLLFTPSDDVNEAVLTTVASSVAVSRAIRRVCGLHCGIKWVNDLYIEGKKVCGILTEAGTDFESGQITHLIVGIGINCHIQDFPEDIRDIAASLDQFEECRDFSSNELAAAVLTELCSILGDMSNRSFMEEYRIDSIVTGKDVKLIQTGREPVNAHVDGINDSGALMVTYLEGERSGESDVIASGEVSLRFH